MADDLAVDPAAVLRGLLTDLREAKPQNLSGKTITDALALCEQLSHLLLTLDNEGLAPGRAQELTSACDSHNATSESSDSEAVTSQSSSHNRPSARTRARLRRQRQRQQQQQLQSEGENDEHQQGQWPEWPTQGWQMYTPGQPLPMVHEQQEQRFLNTLWSGGWHMVPVAPLPQQSPHVATPYPTQRSSHRRAAGGQRTREPSVGAVLVSDESSFRQAMWSGCWHMVPLSTVPPQVGVDESRTTGFRERVIRCMKAHRWQRLQRVWTEWMRSQPASGTEMKSAQSTENAGE